MNRTAPLLFLGLMACTTKDGNGVEGYELRDVDSFVAVRNDSTLPMVVDVGPDFSVEVFCDENLLELFETQVVGDSLELSQPAELVLTPMTSCEVLVSLPTLERIQVSSIGDLTAQGDAIALDYLRNSGWGDIVVDGIDTTDLHIITQSQGRTLLNGVAEVVALENTGRAGIEAGELVIADANVLNAGAGDITATVTDRATIRIEGDGDVVLLGNPETVEVSDDGCGDVY